MRHRLDGQPEHGQRDPVVDQALAFDNGDHAVRRAQPGHHGRRGHRIGGRDRGGERQRGRPAQAGQEQPGHPAHPHDGDRGRAERQPDDASVSLVSRGPLRNAA